jgi:hypothetical protein
MEDMMQRKLVAVGLAAGIGLAGLFFNQDAHAVVADATAMQRATGATGMLEQVQYSERHTRRGIVKCYRTLVIGPYRCHYFRSPI